MSVRVYGINHLAIEVDDVAKAVAFYEDVFQLEKMDEGEGDAFFKIGEHQFLAIFEVDKLPARPNQTFRPNRARRSTAQRSPREIDQEIWSYLDPRFRCDFHDPFGNRIQVVDLHDESLVWLLPYQEVQKAGIRFSDQNKISLIFASPEEINAIAK